MEILVVVFLLSLLIGAVTLLLRSSSRMSRNVDHSILMAMEASGLLNRLRADVIDSVAPPTQEANGSKALAEAACTITDDGFSLEVQQGRALRRITWNFDPAERLLRRGVDGVVMELGQGLVASFSVSYHWLAPDGKIHSIPNDPEQPHLPPAPVPAKVVSVWYKVDLTMADPSNTPQARSQRYLVRLFPILVNRQFRTIWKEDGP